MTVGEAILIVLLLVNLAVGVAALRRPGCPRCDALARFKRRHHHYLVHFGLDSNGRPHARALN